MQEDSSTEGGPRRGLHPDARARQQGAQARYPRLHRVYLDMQPVPENLDPRDPGLLCDQRPRPGAILACQFQFRKG